MRVDVVFSPTQLTPSAVAGRVVAVLDVLRASTSIAAALHHGARAVVPLDSTEEVIKRAKAFDRGEVVLAGERRMRPISGFDIGNSPSEFSADVVEQKTVLLTTTNGTTALTALEKARDVVVSSYVNFTASLVYLRTAVAGDVDVVLLCAGRERQFALEDAACAGRYARHLARRPTVTLSDAAQASMLIEKRYGDRIERLFGDAEHGRALAQAGYVEDLTTCATLDLFPVIPIYADRQVTRLGPERER
jgi:2-phosphosulfolactate phosphatase